MTYLGVVVDDIEFYISYFPVQVLWPPQRTLLYSRMRVTRTNNEYMVSVK